MHVGGWTARLISACDRRVLKWPTPELRVLQIARRTIFHFIFPSSLQLNTQLILRLSNLIIGLVHIDNGGLQAT